MPEVFEHYYSLFGQSAKERLNLQRLSPAYKVFFEGAKPIVIQGDLPKDAATFESIEPNGADKLRRYVHISSQIYQTAVDQLLYSNFNGPSVFLKKDIIRNMPRLSGKLFQTLDHNVSRQFHDQRLQQILEYHSVFLGSSPFEVPAIYSLMSYLDFESGVFYPAGGMASLASDLVDLGDTTNIRYHLNTAVKSIDTINGTAMGITLADNSKKTADIIVSNADLHFTETQLVPKVDQSFPEGYWAKRQSGPSALTISLGVKGKLPRLLHHSLFFSSEWAENFKSIYHDRKVPSQPSFYVCNPTKSDKSMAPPGYENLFILIPLPAGVTLTKKETDQLSSYVIRIISKRAKINDLDLRIVSRHIFGPDEFTSHYNAWLGNAFGGESHLLKQSVFFRTRNKSKKLNNLYYVGAGTLPGIGLPMCLISAELTYKNIMNIRHSRPLKPHEVKEQET